MIVIRRITRKINRLLAKLILRGIRRKLIRSFVNISILRTYEPVLFQLVIPFIHREPFAFKIPEIVEGTPYIDLSVPKISDNRCLQVAKFSVSDNLVAFSIYNYEISQNLNFSGVQIIEIKEEFATLRFSDLTDGILVESSNILNIDISELQELWTELEVEIFNYFDVIYPPSVIGKLDCILLEPYISDDFFEPILSALPQGSDFSSKTQQIKSKEVNSGISQVSKIRKAYSYKQKPSPWDTLYPVLCPPLSFYFDDQFDLFQPLRSYQKIGIEFLVKHPSTLLADEMGTGKTVQAINAMRILFRQGKIRCVLVICPPITVGSARLSWETGRSEGWDGHFYHWAPELEVTVMRDKAEQRKIDWKHPAHVYISTYDTIRNDLQNEILKLSDLNKFDCVVLDEAQKIKNRNSKTAREVRRLKPTYRWALTGTPIENSVEDVKAIFEFVKPDLFERRDYSGAEIKAMIKPYMLRRLKRDVLKDLPEKVYQEEWLELSEKQQRDYDNALNLGRTQLQDYVRSKSENEVRNNILKLVTELKQICNFSSGESTSPKTELLLEFIEMIVSNQEKIIVFSQYRTEGINKLEKLLEHKQIGFVSYVGGMTDKQREQAISDFRSRTDIYIFLAHIDAAGFGITLTEASYVIHFDHPWNPAKMQNAEDRVHRIGQNNKVTVYSFWMRDTIEEKIKKKLYEKRALVENIIDPLALDAAIEKSVSNEEWLDMLGVQHPDQSAKRRGKRSHSTKLNDQTKEPFIDFAVITAIEIERLAVCQAFELTDKDRVSKGSRVYWRGHLKLKNNEFYEIVVAQQSDMANVDSAILAVDIIHHWQPEAILMIGIAGAASAEQKLGDLAIATAVQYYERGKSTPNNSKPEPVQYPVDQTLLNRIIALPMWNDPIAIPRPDGNNERPQIHRGIVASGEKVIANEIVRDEIAATHRKTIAIEMEGYGVSKAAWQSFGRVRHLVIRAICDFADSSKNNEWHSYAAAVAAGYAKHFLLDRPLSPKNTSK